MELAIIMEVNLLRYFIISLCVFVLYINDGVNDNRELIEYLKLYTVPHLYCPFILHCYVFAQTHINIMASPAAEITMRMGMGKSLVWFFQA